MTRRAFARGPAGGIVTTSDLERRLVELSLSLQQPTAPDVTAAVLARLPDRAPRLRQHRTRKALLAATAAVLLLAGGAFALPATRHAILRVLGLRGVVIERVSTLPSLTPRTIARLHLGRRIPLSRARHAASFAAVLPPTASAAYVAHDVPGGRISLLIGRVLVIEFRASGVPFIFKLVTMGTHVRLLKVRGQFAAYLSGRPPFVVFQEPDGTVYEDPIRLAGDVLEWQDGSVTVHIEGVHTLAEGLAIVRTLH